MKLTCLKSELVEIVNTVQKSISPKSTIPILECIKIDASANEGVVFTGNNMDICIEYRKNINVSEGGTIALASKMFGEIIRKLPEGSVDINVNEENEITKIKCGISEFNIQGLRAGEYPSPPEINELYSFFISQRELRDYIKKTISFVAVTEGKRPALTGALFEIKDDSLNVVASDGHRLAFVKKVLNQNLQDSKFIVPGSTLRELFKILKDDDEQIKVIVSDRYALFEFSEFKFFTRLLDGDFLKYEAIINASNTIKIEIETNTLKDSLERALLLINEDNAVMNNRVPVKFNIGFDKIEVSSMTGKGKVNDIINVKLEGDNLIIGFNCRFLLDALNACEEEKVLMELSTPNSGCFIRSLNGENNYVFMVLPVRLYN